MCQPKLENWEQEAQRSESKKPSIAMCFMTEKLKLWGIANVNMSYNIRFIKSNSA